MPTGPGKYDDLCTLVRNAAEARAAVVIVIGGTRGDGFSCQADALITATLPDILETIAAEIRASYPASDLASLADQLRRAITTWRDAAAAYRNDQESQAFRTCAAHLEKLLDASLLVQQAARRRPAVEPPDLLESDELR